MDNNKTNMTNENILNGLIQLAKIEKTSNVFKYRAYLNAINAIDELDFEITDVKQVLHIKGIGKKIGEKIDEILKNGELLNTPKITERQETIEFLSKIYGVGDSKAKELVDKHKIEDLQTLKAKQYELLNEKQRIGLKYYNQLQERIPRKEIDLHKKMILKLWMNDLNNIEKRFKFEIVGSYRRGHKTSGDIDILLTFDEHLYLLRDLVDELLRANYIIEILANGDKKFMGICKLPSLPARRIDILWSSPKEYPFALLYFTGSNKYNRNMREYAQKKGYKLNEKRLINTNTKKEENLNSEEEICNFLEIPYLLPKDRNGPLFLQK